jgi:hypothetical protein
MHLLQNHEWHCLEYSDDISSIRTEYCRDYEAYYYKWITYEWFSSLPTTHATTPRCQ